ncbi:alpha/beta family hydrolase [Micromonospora sp. WMMD729]|uniref:alpha/beta hydrolase family protein n=1 Tax=Micromonospora sp. WMMD729 TaxID=3404127 RepID=UPI003BF57E2C
MPPSEEINTPRGPARIDTDPPAGPTDAPGRPAGAASARPPVALLVLGHGAGGSVDAPDLLAVRDAAVTAGLTVIRVTQPYRVAGRRAPAPAGHLDEAWTAVLAALRERYADVPTILVGGRSSGARVACRTAGAVGAAGVLALAFPLHPPGKPERSRAAELATGLPTLVVNGDRDPFGVPESGPGVQVVTRPGETHDLRRDPAGTGAVVRDWLRSHGWTSD